MFKQRVFESSKVDNEAKTKDRENKHKQAIDFDKRHKQRQCEFKVDQDVL